MDAIHPGYGFLSENADFAEVCETSGITFIGPKPDVIRADGAETTCQGGHERSRRSHPSWLPKCVEERREALEKAGEIGLPVILKAAAGGGGRGMRIVRDLADLPGLLTQAQQEAAASFSCGDIYMEKFVGAPRHIEFQILADHHGNVEVLGERECSIQRRHQKLLEEAPSPVVTPKLRQDITDALREAMRSVGYTNAGTVEFLMDENGKLYFIEVNARIQVEHPVTEFITGVDLVKSQILISAGAKLCDLIPSPLVLRGHAIGVVSTLRTRTPSLRLLEE